MIRVSIQHKIVPFSQFAGVADIVNGAIVLSTTSTQLRFCSFSDKKMFADVHAMRENRKAGKQDFSLSSFNDDERLTLQRERVSLKKPAFDSRTRVEPCEEEVAIRQEGGRRLHGETTKMSLDDDDDDTLANDVGLSYDDKMNIGDEVQVFLKERQTEIAHAQMERNSFIPYPTHPDDIVPEFRRLKRHQAMVVVATEHERPVFARQDQFLQLPPPAKHPWVKNTPIGPFILHGDGQLNVAGSGEVGFDNTHVAEALPCSFRGLRHCSVLQRCLPQKNGKVIQDAVIKNSFTLTGRGVFATRDIAAGENIMVVRNTARNVGVKSEIERLIEMCSDILITVHEGDEADLTFLHEWILTGQPSSLLEYWPAYATERVLELIGGVEVLHALELHEIHIARICAIIDMNSFLVESFYAVRKGMAYFPEAGFLNHSCAPNATYDIIPEHTFSETDYNVDEVVNAAGKSEELAKDLTSRSAEQSFFFSALKEKNSFVLHSGSCHDKNVCGVHENSDGTATGTGINHSTAIDAPVEYLFCCRATKNISKGTEILISYVPSDWSFDNRQYVLHDRYRFWCKCPNCAPTLDGRYARVPQLIVFLLLVSVFLQLLVLYVRDAVHVAVQEELAEEERTPTSHRGHHENNGMGMAKTRHQPRGLFEMIKEDKLREMYSLDRQPLPAPIANDPWAQPPR